MRQVNEGGELNEKTQLIKMRDTLNNIFDNLGICNGVQVLDINSKKGYHCTVFLNAVMMNIQYLEGHLKNEKETSESPPSPSSPPSSSSIFSQQSRSRSSSDSDASSVVINGLTDGSFKLVEVHFKPSSA